MTMSHATNHLLDTVLDKMSLFLEGKTGDLCLSDAKLNLIF